MIWEQTPLLFFCYVHCALGRNKFLTLGVSPCFSVQDSPRSPWSFAEFRQDVTTAIFFRSCLYLNSECLILKTCGCNEDSVLLVKNWRIGSWISALLGDVKSPSKSLPNFLIINQIKDTYCLKNSSRFRPQFPGGNILSLFRRWGLGIEADMQGTITKENKKDSIIIYRLYMVNDFPK
jgi:hypothetical protein